MIWFVVTLLTIMLIYWLFMSPYSQVFGAFPYFKQTDKRVVALTFDDGPNEPYTSQIVDFLNSQSIHATFFQVGKCVERHPTITKKMIKSGHVIGNHSLSHQFRTYFRQPSYRSEINTSQEIMKRAIGKKPALFRPPWLWRQPLVFKTLSALKLQPVSGSFCHVFEVFQPDARRIAGRTLAKIRPGSIIIFHDGFNATYADRTQTVKALKIVVKELQSVGYSFVTVDELLNVPAYL